MYQFVSDVAEPFTLVALALVVGWFWFQKRLEGYRWQRFTISVLLVALVLMSTPLAAYWATWSLERAYPPMRAFPEDVAAIVVLNGGFRVYDKSAKTVEMREPTALRAKHAAELYHRADRPLVVPSGGRRPEPLGTAFPEATCRFLLMLGVDSKDLLPEDRSSSTHENAVRCWELLQPRNIRRIVLVTDATHMHRASRCFRAAGFEVVPAACNYRAGQFEMAPSSFFPSPQAASDFEIALHEWLGLVWYWLHGRL